MAMTVRTLEQVIDLIQDRSYKDEKTGCFVYTGCTNDNGYGIIAYNKRQWLVHRLVFKEVMFKELPAVVRHSCDNPPCWNPEHLIGGTCLDNIVDKITRNRHNKGIDQHRSVLTEEAVIEIRRMQNPNYVELAKHYNVDRSAIRKVVLGITWKHIESC